MLLTQITQYTSRAHRSKDCASQNHGDHRSESPDTQPGPPAARATRPRDLRPRLPNAAQIQFAQIGAPRREVQRLLEQTLRPELFSLHRATRQIQELVELPPRQESWNPGCLLLFPSRSPVVLIRSEIRRAHSGESQ